MRMVRLQTKQGDHVWINPDHVVAVGATFGGGHTFLETVNYTGDEIYELAGEPEDAVERLTGEKL